MSHSHWLAMAAIAAPCAVAQQTSPVDDPANPAAAVAAADYRSAFSAYRAIKEEGQSPDKIWRDANIDVGRLGGHAGHGESAPAGQAPSSQRTHTGDKGK